MNASEIYILIAIVSLLLIAIFLFFIKKTKKQEKLSPLAGLSFAFVIAGICFGDNRFISYAFFGIGILIAFIDIYIKTKKKKKK